MFTDNDYELTHDVADENLKRLLEKFINQFIVTRMTICVSEEDPDEKSLCVEYEHPAECKDMVYFGMDDNYIVIDLPDGDAHKAVNSLFESA